MTEQSRELSTSKLPLLPPDSDEMVETVPPANSAFTTFTTSTTIKTYYPHDDNYEAPDLKRAGQIFSSRALQKERIAPIRWVVPGLISEGVGLIAGPPKIGKSWFSYGLAFDVAIGNDALGGIDLNGPVATAYFALEDGKRRLQSRLRKISGDGEAPGNLYLSTSLPAQTAPRDLDDFLARQKAEGEPIGLVIIDVLQKLRPPVSDRNEYQADYQLLGVYKALADYHSVAILFVHHTRKGKDEDDVFNEVRGSTGLTGAVDFTLMLKKPRNEQQGTLSITGRDITESEYALTFSPESCRWSLTGESLAEAQAAAMKSEESSNLGDTMQAYLAIVDQHPEGIDASRMSEELGKLSPPIAGTDAGVRLNKLHNQGRIMRIRRGVYAPLNRDVGKVEVDGGKSGKSGKMPGHRLAETVTPHNAGGKSGKHEDVDPDQMPLFER